MYPLGLSSLTLHFADCCVLSLQNGLHLFERDVSLKRHEDHIFLWSEGQILKMQLKTGFSQESGSCRSSSMTSLALGQLFMVLVAGIISLLLNRSQRVDYCRSMAVTTVLLWLLWQTSHYYGSSMSLLGRTVDCFPPLKAGMAPSGTMKAKPQTGAFSQFQFRGLWAVSEMNGVSSNRDLPSSSGGKQGQQQYRVKF